MDRKNIDIEVILSNIPNWKYDAMEIRAELIETREKCAKLYLETGNDEILKTEILKIMGDIYRAIDALKRL